MKRLFFLLAIALLATLDAGAAAASVHDDFAAPDQTLLSAPGRPDAPGWTLLNGTDAARLVDGRLRFQPGVSAFATYRGMSAHAATDCTIEAKIRVAAPIQGELQLYGRGHDAGGNYAFHAVSVAPWGLRVYARTSGKGEADATLLALPRAWVAGQTYTVRLSFRGTAQHVHIDDELVYANSPAAPTAISGATNDVGIILAASSAEPCGFELDAFRADFTESAAAVTTSPVTRSAAATTETPLPPTPVTAATPAPTPQPSRAPKTFYLSAAGRDSHDGQSARSAWRSIEKLNAHGLAPGDTILFRGGDTFEGSLLISPAAQPTAAALITVSSYGTGRATLAPVSGYGIKVLDCGHVAIRDLAIKGDRLKVSGSFPARTVRLGKVSWGILLETTDPAARRSSIVIERVEISGCNDAGIQAHNTHAVPTAGFEDVRVSHARVHHCGFAGIVFWGTNQAIGTFQTRINRNLILTDCEVHDIVGNGLGGASGFGIVVFNASDSVVERCVAHTCGEASNPAARNGTCAFIFAFCTRCRWSHCEGYNVYAQNNVDGNAFDFDADCDDCVCEYCYGHDTDGAAFLHWNDDNGASASSGCIVRYCIFVDGGRRMSSNGGACFATAGAVGSPLVHNCIFFRTHNGTGLPELIRAAAGETRFYNNIFSVGDGAVFGNFGARIPLGNVYDVRRGSTFAVVLNGVAHAEFSALRAAGYEKFEGRDVGAAGDPVFKSPGAKPAMLPKNPVSQLAAYDLGERSAARGVGVDLRAIVPGIAWPLRDWHQNAAGGARAGDPTVGPAVFDAGPVHFGSVANPAEPTHRTR
jgi:hypothetical protein